MTGDRRRIAAGIFVVAWGTNVSTPLILRYQDRLDLSDSGAVGIFSVYVLGILLALLFAGRMSDRFGRRPLVLPLTAASAIGSLILVAGRDSLAVLFAGRFLLGAVSGAMLSVGTAWLTEVEPRPHGREVTDTAVDTALDIPPGSGTSDDGHATTAAERLSTSTITTIVMYVGFGFGPITSAVYDRLGPSPLIVPYVVHAVACVVMLAAMRSLPETKRPDPSVSLRPRLGVPAAARSEFVRVLAPAAVWVFGFPSVGFALFPIILRDAIGGADVLLAGAIGTLTALAVLLSRPVLQRVGDARRALPVALWMGVVGYAIGVVAFAQDWWWLAPVAAIALGTASGVLMSSGLAITEELADATNRGALSSTFYLAAYSGMSMPLVITGLANLSTTTTALGAVTVAAVVVAISVTAQLRSKAPVLV